MKHDPIRIVKGELEQLSPGEVVITLNISTGGLDHFTSKRHGYQYLSKDEMGIVDARQGISAVSRYDHNIEDLLDISEKDELDDDARQNIAASAGGEEVEKSVRAAYRMAGIRVPRRFTSMAARIKGFPTRNSDLTPYGDVVIVVDPQEVRDHLVVFSGDVKTLGGALLKGQCNHARTWRLTKSVGTLANQLMRYRKCTQLLKCTIGRYFEARLTRALKVTDIAKIYVPDGNEHAWKAAHKINMLKLHWAQKRPRL